MVSNWRSIFSRRESQIQAEGLDFAIESLGFQVENLDFPMEESGGLCVYSEVWVMCMNAHL